MNTLPNVLKKYIIENFLPDNNDLLTMRLVDKTSNEISTQLLNKRIEPEENQISEKYFLKFVQHKVKKCFLMALPSLPFCLEGKDKDSDKSLFASGMTNAIKSQNPCLIELKEGEKFDTAFTYSLDSKSYYTSSFANFTYKIDSIEENDKTFNNLKGMLSRSSSTPPVNTNFTFSKENLKFIAQQKKRKHEDI